MLTHDIDEAIYLSDRIVVMTDGPRTGIREIVEVPLERPRDKRWILHDPRYADTKKHLLDLLTSGPDRRGGVAAPLRHRRSLRADHRDGRPTAVRCSRPSALGRYHRDDPSRSR